MNAVHAAPRDHQLAFVKAHPELANRVDRASSLTQASQAEQTGLGLDRLPDDEFERFQKLNSAYRERFGLPFVICVGRHSRDSVLCNIATRLENDFETEFRAALDEIGLITRLRLVAKVDGPGKPKTEGALTIHVLDTMNGKAAAGVFIELFEVGSHARASIIKTATNSDGRTDRPLLSGAPLRIGTYELQFGIGDYFASQATADPPYLDIVPIRFSIAEPEGHYHVALLVTPWSYATYRGS